MRLDRDDVECRDWFAGLWEEAQRRDEEQVGHELPLMSSRLPLPEDFDE